MGKLRNAKPPGGEGPVIDNRWTMDFESSRHWPHAPNLSGCWRWDGEETSQYEWFLVRYVQEITKRGQLPRKQLHTVALIRAPRGRGPALYTHAGYRWHSWQAWNATLHHNAFARVWAHTETEMTLVLMDSQKSRVYDLDQMLKEQGGEPRQP